MSAIWCPQPPVLSDGIFGGSPLLTSVAFVFCGHRVRWDMVSSSPHVQWGWSFATHLKTVLLHFPTFARSLLEIFHHFHGRVPARWESLQLDIHVALLEHSGVSIFSSWSRLHSRVLCGCSRSFAGTSVSSPLCSAQKEGVYRNFHFHFPSGFKLPFEFVGNWYPPVCITCSPSSIQCQILGLIHGFIHFLAVTRSGPGWAGTF